MPRGKGKVEERPKLWDYEKCAELSLQSIPRTPLDWKLINALIESELDIGRPVVLIPPPKEKK